MTPSIVKMPILGESEVYGATVGVGCHVDRLTLSATDQNDEELMLIVVWSSTDAGRGRFL